MSDRLRLLFVSPRFLFPPDSGGKIRTSQILKGMKDGAFEITLASPAPPGARDRFASDLDSVCNRFASWPEPTRGPMFRLSQARHLASRVPIPVATDASQSGRRVIDDELARSPDLVLFDFLHSAVLAPATLEPPSVLFTHNVEAEIFRRHVEVARNPLMRALWQQQLDKMVRYERDTLRRFDTVIAVSERDREAFRRDYGVAEAQVIRTGVDLAFFAYQPPPSNETVVFTGSMDWLANIDAIQFMMDEVWPLLVSQVPSAAMVVAGRNPPAKLREQAGPLGWNVTGFVDDVRPYVHAAAVYAIPLRVGGGTRIKVFEAMAMGCPVVSTSIGVEGLSLVEDKHYLRADSPREFADAIVRVMQDQELRERMSRESREFVEAHASSQAVARQFEEILLHTAKST